MHGTMIVIIDSALVLCKMKLVMLKISELILYLLETKGMEGEEKRGNARDR